MKNYGVPYMGSKNTIAVEVVQQLPRAKHFYDLFAGGCAITHASMESGKYEQFHCNDIDWRGVTLFKDAIDGKYRNERRVITREDFFRLKDTDAYVALCWSFGNRADAYLYGEDWENLMLPATKMLLSENEVERRLAFRDYIKAIRPAFNLVESDTVFQVKNLERLERVIALERLEITIGNYYDVPILPDSVVYCDPPYKGTGTYDMNDRTGGFDHDRFYDWLRSTPFPVYVSEYSMPDDFVSVWSKEKRSLLSATNKSKVVTEHLFVHKKWINQVKIPAKQLTLF